MSHNIVNEQIAFEIGRKFECIEKLRESPIELILSRFHEKSAEKDSLYHSSSMEVPILCKNDSCRNRRRSVLKGSKNLKDALHWGISNFDPKSLSHDFFQKLGAKVDPNCHLGNIAYYRKMSVRPLGATWTPPYPEKIPAEMIRYMDALEDFLKDDSIRGVLQSAAYAHLHFVRIHPFEDGNGRTARTIQNIILKSRNLPSPVIYEGERFDYFNHLQDAIEDWRVKNSGNQMQSGKGEYQFYNYIAGKVSAALDLILTR